METQIQEKKLRFRRTPPKPSADFCCYVAGKAASSDERLVINNPYTNKPAGTVGLVGAREVDLAIAAALDHREKLTRFERSQVLERARQRLEQRREEFAILITSESGLCLRDTRY